MAEYILISYPVACSLLIATVTLFIVNAFGALRSKHAPGALAADSAKSQTQLQPYKLPAGQWSGQAAFELERRAVLSRNWICISHQSRFSKPGDYITFEFSGFRIFLILGKDRILRAFHNVCRHRAFPVTHKASGSATILGCRYHGWSYDTKGQLTKAPQFDKLPGFDKSQNSLFEIHTKTDAKGFVHINLESAPAAGISELGAPSVKGNPAKIGTGAISLRSLEFQGNFNWKCAFLDHIQDDGPASLLSHGLQFTDQMYFYPTTAVYTDSKSSLWFQLAFSPNSVNETTVRCDVFASNPSDRERFEKVVEVKLDNYLKARLEHLEKQHQSVEDSSCVPGDITHEFERLLHEIQVHSNEEKAANIELNPAQVQQCKSALFNKAEGICKALEAYGGKLDW